MKNFRYLAQMSERNKELLINFFKFLVDDFAAKS